MSSVCVVMPVFNPGKEFIRAYSSVLTQTHKALTLIIVDDCSVFGHDLIDEAAKTESVMYLKTEKNSGGGAARNLGLKYCKSDYIAFCDSDDIWPVDKISKQINFMETNKYLMSHTDSINIDTNNNEYRFYTSDIIDIKIFLSKTNLYCSSVCVHNSIIKNNTFSELRVRHPFKFWVSILESGTVSYKVPDTYIKYLKRKNSVSSKTFTTLFYTFISYVYYPKNKFLSIYCLLIRIFNANSRNSRIYDGFKK
jgi:teichuronic acid biosynthesis glycosyltransferase TuaG